MTVSEDGPRRFFAGYMYRHVRDFVLYQDSENAGELRKAQEAAEWINGSVPGYREVDENGKPIGPIIPKPFMTFDSVCEILDKDPEVMREKILRLTKKTLFNRLETCAKEAESQESSDDGSGDDE